MDAVPRRPTPDDDTVRLRTVLLSDAYAADLRPGSPKLLMLAGLPGAGKSAFAREVTSRCPFLTLESDRLRKSLVPQPQYTPDEHRRVFRACHRLLDELLGQGYPLLFRRNQSDRKESPPGLLHRPKAGRAFRHCRSDRAAPDRPATSARPRGWTGPGNLVRRGMGHTFPNGPGLGASEASAYRGGHFR